MPEQPVTVFELVGESDAGICVDGVCALPERAADDVVRTERLGSSGQPTGTAEPHA